MYVDNGANYRSQHLALVCAKLGVALIHARPYQPQGKGKMERWFRTARAQLVRRLGSADTDRLDTLNRRLWAWVEGEYHQAPHRGLEQQTPLDRWALSADKVRLPGPHLDLDALFLFEAKRRVQRDRTVSLNGTLFEVDAALIGHTVTLRYDPSAAPARVLRNVAAAAISKAGGVRGRSLVPEKPMEGQSEMNRHLVTTAILLIALALYGFGFAGIGLAAFGAGAVFELWFWLRVIVRRGPANDTGQVPGK